MSIEEFRGDMLSSVTFYESSLICAIQATLFSCNTVALPLMEGSPHVSCICWIIDLSYTHSRLVLYGLKRYSESAYPSNCCFDSLE